ncbi:MAG: insulinase family protein [Cyclobacteriaceae bacterium]|nr:insulinase family protein [Cyclobacteriaceae bacterium]
MRYKTLYPAFILVLLLGCGKPEPAYETKTAESNGYTYEYVTNDPMGVRVYTLKNGLKVYLSDYKIAPRIQTCIAVRAGGRNDPADNTGLAHYLEHMMFKGTSEFGTLDWEKERVLLDSIESMFQHYRTLTDAADRKAYYRLIDQVSNEASRLAIPNEYDRMVSALGAQGTNAYTTEDRTVYINDIPANQVENWLRIESSRFQMIVNRLFHTELEAVYEEKNRSLDNDYWKSYEALSSGMFSDHPYGTQTVIGTIDHLKNPSITAIREYFTKYYVPNNVAICLSGDLDYDRTIALIDKYFGEWEPNPSLSRPSWPDEAPLATPIEKEVVGPFEEFIFMGFRFDGFMSEEHRKLKLVDMLLSNSEAGLIDINLKQKQRVLDAYSYINAMDDYSVHFFQANPREGQSLEEVKNLILEQIELIKKGEFDDWLLEAVINDFRKNAIQQRQNNYARANQMVLAFTNDVPWAEMVKEVDDMQKITREELVRFANEHYKDNYVVVYKRTGKDPNARQVDKPEITKVTLNREERSPFHEQLLASEPEPIKPVFLDYEKDVTKLQMDKGIEVLYKKNDENELFNLYYLTETGTNNDPKRQVAVQYLEYLGTDSLAAEEFRKELYKLGCSFNVFVSPDQTYVMLSGLADNMAPAMTLFEHLLNNPRGDEEALANMIDGLLKTREDNKKNKYTILYEALLNYGIYGPRSPFTNVLSNSELRALKPDDLLPIIRSITSTEHKVLYYGPASESELLANLNERHMLPEQLQPAPDPVEFPMQDVVKPAVFWTDYDMVQAEIVMHAKGPVFDPSNASVSRLYNEYFGGNMSSIVFQEIREAQGLAYAVSAGYYHPAKAGDHDRIFAYVGTQADKQAESMAAMLKIMNEMPESGSTLEAARKSILNQIESERIVRTSVLFSYLSAKRRGLDYDLRQDVYKNVPTLGLEDIRKFQEKYVKGRDYNIMVLGSRDKLNFNDLRKYGEVREVSLDELFGYEKVERINIEGAGR